MSRPDAPPLLPPLSRAAPGEPVFPEAWQARAFALAVELNRRGRLAWPEFTAVLGAEIARDGDDYWRAWLRALQGWLDSPAHCENMMDARFSEVGVACVGRRGSAWGTYWTMVLGRR